MYIIPPPPKFSLFFRSFYILRIFLTLTVFLVFNFTLFSQTGDNVLPADKWYNNFFVAGEFQSYLPIPVLKDYTEPKPGYRLSLGYTFLHSKQHNIPLFIEGGHSFISGTNPLVRSFDIYPINLNIAYEWTPVKYFSIGAFTGGGIHISSIKHYPTVVDMLENKLNKAKEAGGLLKAGLILGSNISEKNIEFRISFSADIILEKPKLIPLPSFQAGIRFYPMGLSTYAKKLKTQKNENTAKLPLKEFDAIYVFFNPDSYDLDVNAKAEIKKAAEIIKQNSDIFAVMESSTAPLGSKTDRLILEENRIRTIADYLKENCRIDAEKIIYTELLQHENTDQKKSESEEFYTQYRYVKIRFVRIKFNSQDGKNIYKIDGEKNEKNN